MSIEKLPKKLKAWLITITVIEVVSACLAVYMILHPHETIAKVSSITASITSTGKVTNQYLPTAKKIAHEVSKNGIANDGRMIILEVYVDQNGKTYAGQIHGSLEIVDEKPNWESCKQMVGAINFVKLPLGKTAAFVTLTDDFENTLGQTVTIYSEKK